MASKKISFSVPDWMYEHIQGLLNIKNPSYRVDDLFKACAINRFIQIGYLDEFGTSFTIPALDFSNINTGISFSSIREAWKDERN